jgi:hypothetical protein
MKSEEKRREKVRRTTLVCFGACQTTPHDIRVNIMSLNIFFIIHLSFQLNIPTPKLQEEEKNSKDIKNQGRDTPIVRASQRLTFKQNIFQVLLLLLFSRTKDTSPQLKCYFRSLQKKIVILGSEKKKKKKIIFFFKKNGK